MTSVLNRHSQLQSQPAQRDDRRATRRYGLQTFLRYRAVGSSLTPVWKHGRTLDMSASGILIDIPERHAAGTRVELAMDWTGLYHGTEMMRLFVIGRVKRADGRGTALRILSHRFRDAYPAAVLPQCTEKSLAVA